jgi:ABC-2 type transport system permease protein
MFAMNNKEQDKGPNQFWSGGTAMRLRGMVRKEFLQIVRDPSSIAIAFLMPVLLLLLFGYGVSLDAEHVPVAVVVEDPSVHTTSFTAKFFHSKYFEPVFITGLHEAKQALIDHKVDGIICLKSDFSRKLKTGYEPAPIQVILNGIDSNTARLVSGYVQGIWATWIEELAQKQGSQVPMPVNLQQRIWFNSQVRSQNFLVPGLVAVIMTLIGALLTAMIVSREWERGTMEALMSTPVTIGEILLGKIIPYFVLGMGGMLLTVALTVWLFDVPLRGSFWVLVSTSALFLLTALGMGLFISTIARNQFIAGQAAIIVTFLPAFLLSGFIFDIESMPAIVQAITYIIAARYFIMILQTVFLAGNVWSVIIPNAFALLVLAIIFLGLSRFKSYKRLD